ncbi:MAG: hypothetical protein FJ293_09565 [Planctomycetes bacterium]|nr:hypothetical protein [Planctomycetota bacterium]
MSPADKAPPAAASAPPPLTAPVEPPPPPLSFLQRLHRFTERFGHLMSRVILTVLYLVLVGPAGLILSLFCDPLRIKRWKGSAWNGWNRTNDTLELARRQD